MANLGAVVADVVLGVVLGHLFEQLLRACKVLVDENLRVVVGTLGALLAVAVEVVPAEFSDDVFELAEFSVEAEAHVEIGTAFVDVAVGAVLALFTFLLHKIWANFEIMAEVALVSVTADTHRLELVARLYLALVMRVGAVVGQTALAVYKLLANSVGGQFVVVGRRGLGFLVGWPLVLGIEAPIA